ncbi:MAG: hypothetical protein MK359_06115 [SAR202 cluster bacterium]|nr:hypothetical protein [SAR202 cluster bacterium]
MNDTRKEFSIPSPLIPIASLLVVIIISSILLAMPGSQSGDEEITISTIIFTSISASTLTGLTIVSTETAWTILGKSIILGTIYISGIIYVTLSVMLLNMFTAHGIIQHGITFNPKISITNLRKFKNLIKSVIILNTSIQLIALVILATKLYLSQDIYREITNIKDVIWISLFHTVSAFNNSGFSIIHHDVHWIARDPIIILVTIVLVILGSLGFLSLSDLFRNRDFKSLTLNTKIILGTIILIILSGSIQLFFTELQNNLTLGKIDFLDKLLISGFNGSSAHTSGFTLIDYSKSHTVTQLYTSITMLFGGAPTSVAGGIRLTTIAITFLSIIRIIQGRNDISIFGKTINPFQVQKAFIISTLSLFTFLILFLLMILVNHELSFLKLLFQTSSAFGNSGLANGQLNEISSYGLSFLSLAMILGRILPISAMLFINQRASYSDDDIFQYPEERVTIG